VRFSPFILACLAAYPLAAQTETGGAISVHVVNSVTGTPIAGANVVLQHERDERLFGRTNAGGSFAGRMHSAGSHLLTVTRKGYRMTGGGMGKMVEAKAGSDTETTVEMLPLGVLSGRILDQYGDPVRHAIVRTEDEVSVPGQGQYYESFSAATTDDRGEYRITEVEPGKHYVAAEYNSTDEERSSGARSRYLWPQAGGLVLYPDAADIKQAQQIEIAAGASMRLNDIQLKIQRAVTVSGRIVPPPSENRQSLSLTRTAKLALHSSPMVQGGGSEVDGSFKMDVLPGKYVLTASDVKTGKVSKAVAIEVGDRDITGLQLELSAAYEINGRVIVDGPERIDFSKLTLNFGGSRVKLDADGTFQTNLYGGKGSYMLQGLPDDWYVKTFVVAGKEITGRKFEVEQGMTDIIFTLDPRGASVSIGLADAAGATTVAYVTLLPETGGLPDVESILAGHPNTSGSFTVRAVPPGSYRVFTLDATNFMLLMRPDILLEKYRNVAPLISVTPGEQKRIVVPVVKIRPE